ncbi:MAG: hypothetical protein QM736_07440 [Vicinamibacterales bacterium]
MNWLVNAELLGHNVVASNASGSSLLSLNSFQPPRSVTTVVGLITHVSFSTSV